jgi:putative SOS response-associated peptidase YedK
MCGRYVTPTMAEMERFWALTNAQIHNPLEQRFNVAPTTFVPIIYQAPRGIEQDSARWGLIPVWWDKPTPPPFTFNTRIEEASNKPMWRAVLRSTRCLVPAVGWYEWKESEGIDPATGEIKKVKQPYFIHLRARRMFAFAGLMSSWRLRVGNGEQKVISTCSILTRAAVSPAAEVHDRMPIILPQPAHAAWLDRDQEDAGKVLAMARDVAVTDVEFFTVSTRVNHSTNEGPELLTPLQEPV